ncbi:MAG: hypothetical protein ACXAD7_25655, partial [Candidatus Kariarchaeaceae archaeon]
MFFSHLWTNHFLLLMSILLIIGGVILLILMRDRFSQNILFWVLFPVTHGLHELVEETHETWHRNSMGGTH